MEDGFLKMVMSPFLNHSNSKKANLEPNGSLGASKITSDFLSTAGGGGQGPHSRQGKSDGTHHS